MSSSTEQRSGGEIRVPRGTVNDDVVIVAGWRYEDGARVRRGECVVEIETSKSVLELEAEADGFLQIIHPQGAEVPVGELIGRLLLEPASAAARTAVTGATTQDGGAAPVQLAISKKAQQLIDAYGIDPEVFAGCGMVREADVIRYVEQRAAETAGEQVAPPAVHASAGDAVADEPPAPPVAPELIGETRVATGSRPAEHQRSHGVFSNARASAGDRRRGVVWLVWNYFWRNWLLGNLVKVAPRGVISVLHRMRGVRMGHDCFIDPSATLETAYPENITLGNDVRVTVGAIVMTHIKAPNYLRETGIMPVVIKPVRLEDHCFIGVNAVVMPGVTVGRASVVTCGSVVVSNVPPFTMVGGNPARVLKHFPEPDGEAEP